MDMEYRTYTGHAFVDVGYISSDFDKPLIQHSCQTRSSHYTKSMHSTFLSAIRLPSIPPLARYTCEAYKPMQFLQFRQSRNGPLRTFQYRVRFQTGRASSASSWRVFCERRDVIALFFKKFTLLTTDAAALRIFEKSTT